jgi:hypothetical protein
MGRTAGFAAGFLFADSLLYGLIHEPFGLIKVEFT